MAPQAERPAKPSPEATGDRTQLEDLTRSLAAELEEASNRLNNLPE